MKRSLVLLGALGAVVIVLVCMHRSAAVVTPSSGGVAAPRAAIRAAPGPSLSSPPRALLPSDDVARAEAIVRAVAEPTPETAELLRDVIANDPSPSVRERAVIAYADMLGKGAAPWLRELAAGVDDETVATAAAASLHRIRNEFPDPARAHVAVAMPEHFEPGAAVDVVIRCVADDDVPKAYFAVKLPPEIAVVEGDVAPWRGKLAAGEVFERRLRVRIQAGAKIRARFTADFADMFDAETVQLRIAAGDGTLRSSTQMART
jgi:hypothetical protein